MCVDEIKMTMRTVHSALSVEVFSGVRIVRSHAIMQVVIDVCVVQCHASVHVVIGVRLVLCCPLASNSTFLGFLLRTQF